MGQATPGAFSPLSRPRPKTRTIRSPPSSQQDTVRVSGTLRPALAPASPQALAIPYHSPILSHPLAALRTSRGERGAVCQRSPTPDPAGLRQRGPGRFPEEPGEKFEAKSGGGGRVDSRGTRSQGGVQLSACTHSTDTQPRHVDRHRPRTRTHNGEPTGSPDHTRVHKTWAPAQNACAKSPTHKGTGGCTSPNPNPQRPTTVRYTCPHKDPTGDGPRPRHPGSAFVFGKPSPQVRVPQCRRVPGVRQRLLSLWLQVKLRGLGRTRAPPARGMARRGRGLRTLARRADSGST